MQTNSNQLTVPSRPIRVRVRPRGRRRLLIAACIIVGMLLTALLVYALIHRIAGTTLIVLTGITELPWGPSEKHRYAGREMSIRDEIGHISSVADLKSEFLVWETRVETMLKVLRKQEDDRYDVWQAGRGDTLAWLYKWKYSRFKEQREELESNFKQTKLAVEALTTHSSETEAFTTARNQLTELACEIAMWDNWLTD